MLNLKQNGYATVLTLILFSALGLSLFAMFNSGQIVTHKLKLQNAVDSATYSSVNLIARELNYMAYTNRAMVANQVFVGQMVAVDSWNKQMVKSGQRIEQAANYLSSIPYVGAAANAIAQGFKATTVVANGYYNTFSSFRDLAISSQINVNKALSNSQYLVHLATGAVFAKVYPNILQDNNKIKTDPNDSSDKIITATIAPALTVLKNFSKLKRVTPANLTSGLNFAPPNSNSSNNDYDNLKKVVINSDDGFVGTKDFWGRSNYWGLAIRKRGGNKFELDKDKKEWVWSAMDGVQFYYRLRLGFFSHTFSYDIGWGAAHSSNEPSYNYRRTNDWGNIWDRKTRSVANNAKYQYSNNNVGKKIDLIPFYKYRNGGNEVIGPSFIAAISKDNNGVRTQKTFMQKTGNALSDSNSLNIEQKGNMNGNKMYAIAKAEVYFARSFEKNVITASSSYVNNNPPRASQSQRNQQADAAGIAATRKGGYAQYEVCDSNGIRTTIDCRFGNRRRAEDGTAAACVRTSRHNQLKSKLANWKRREYEFLKIGENDAGDIIEPITSLSAQRQVAYDNLKSTYDLSTQEYLDFGQDICEKIDLYKFAHDDFIEQEAEDYRATLRQWKLTGQGSISGLQFARLNDTQVEYANVFNPYWQVRMVDYTTIEKTQATNTLNHIRN